VSDGNSERQSDLLAAYKLGKPVSHVSSLEICVDERHLLSFRCAVWLEVLARHHVSTSRSSRSLKGSSGPGPIRFRFLNARPTASASRRRCRPCRGRVPYYALPVRLLAVSVVVAAALFVASLLYATGPKYRCAQYQKLHLRDGTPIRDCVAHERNGAWGRISGAITGD
jgi:hypothetical protein